MHDPHSFRAPRDQAQGLRRLFAQAGVRLLPVVSNPHVAFGGVLLERLCVALAEQGARTLIVDACEQAPAPAELSVMGLAECVEKLSPDMFYLAARTLPLRYVDSHGSTAPFLQAAVDAAPDCDTVLVHAGASELSRMFARQAISTQVRPVLLAGDHPTSVTHAYAAMKLLAQRGQMMVYRLLLGAAPGSPRAPRIAEQLASCADGFLGALLHDWALVDPAAHLAEPTPAALRRLARGLLQPPPNVATVAPQADAEFPNRNACAMSAARPTSGFSQALN